ncbi:MAG: hypothetical protein EOP92_19400, partial [Lysobacteraceae bacterium]
SAVLKRARANIISQWMPTLLALYGSPIRNGPLGSTMRPTWPSGPLRIGDPYKAKSVGIHWEMMFARARFRTADMIEQHRLLNRVASLVDAGDLRTTHTATLGAINAENLREVHRRLESGTTIGKLVLAGW